MGGNSIAFVLLVEGQVLPDAVRREHLIAFPSEPPPDLLSDPGASPVLWRLGSDLITGFVIDTPVPAQELEGPAAAAYWWPEAAAMVPGHRQHWVLAQMRASDAPTRLARVTAARRLTRIVAATVAVAGAAAIGVFWTTSRVLMPAAAFTALAQQELPLSLWMDLRLLRGASPQEVGATTRGLAAFVDRELTIVPTTRLPPTEVAQRCLGLATYLLSSEVVLQDGDTVGVSAHERLRVRTVDDAAQGGPLYEITVETDAG